MEATASSAASAEAATRRRSRLSEGFSRHPVEDRAINATDAICGGG